MSVRYEIKEWHQSDLCKRVSDTLNTMIPGTGELSVCETSAIETSRKFTRKEIKLMVNHFEQQEGVVKFEIKELHE